MSLTVFAAASLTDAFSELGAAFSEAHPGVEVRLQVASSSTLAAQINQGAPADVYASANPHQMQLAIDSGRIDAAAAQTFARNALALAIPRGNPAQLDKIDDLTRPGVLIALASPGVPVRAYTDVLLTRLSDEAFYGPDFQTRLLANVVTEETNVRRVVARLLLGEVDAGFVYRTDLRAPDAAAALNTLPFPAELNPSAAYPIAPLNDTPHPDAARAFVAFVLSQAGQRVLAAWGFCPPSEASPC